MKKLPRHATDDHSHEAAAARIALLREETGALFEHVTRGSIEPALTKGNIESFVGVVQVPLGVAGPLLVRGEHVDGEVYVPLATTEGTLVASYNRGMRVLRESGGAKTTVLDDRMQRAPLFVFDDARHARDFGRYVEDHFEEIKAKAEETTRSGKLVAIEQYAIGKLRWLRFDFTTGDAAGQNMVSRATRHACMALLARDIPGLEHFTLAANMDTDKKHSHLNALHSRGKRVVAEVTVPASVLEQVMHVTPRALHRQRELSNMGSLLSASINNGSHSANAVAAIFLACGQDVANVAESSAAQVHSEVRPDGAFYLSLTIPSLVVATYGGGTGLPTQRECLALMDCVGAGKVKRFAEIVAATALAGELSLASAVVADEWVSSHEAHGRNR